MNWKGISNRILEGGTIQPEEALALLESPDDELLDVLQAAYQVRKKHFGKTVSLHLLRNVKAEFAQRIAASVHSQPKRSMM